MFAGGTRAIPSAGAVIAKKPLEVAYAGSMGSLMEGPIKQMVASALGITWHGRGQGSIALARLIAAGTITPDVFVGITPTPMRIVLRAGKARTALPFARTEMVIAYSPLGRSAADFKQADAHAGNPWWQVLEQSGIRFGRSDPVTDPQGRNIIFTLELAARLYRQPNLVPRILGDPLNASQIFPEPTVLARLQAGELDAAAAYKTQPQPLHLPFVHLPPEINLGSPRLSRDYAQVSVDLGGSVYRPEPLVYYASVMNDASNPAAATALVNWLTGPAGQTVLRQFQYDPAGDAQQLHV